MAFKIPELKLPGFNKKKEVTDSSSTFEEKNLAVQEKMNRIYKLGGISGIVVPGIVVDGFGKRTGAVGSLSALAKVVVSVVGSGFLSLVVGSNSFLTLPKVSVFGTGIKQPPRTGAGEIEIAVSTSGSGFLVGTGICSVVIPVLLIGAFGKLGAVQSYQTLGNISIPLVSITGSAFVQEDFEFSENDAVLCYSFGRRLL